MAKKRRMLLFGGPALESPAQTWYMTKSGRQIFAGPGDAVDPDTVENPDAYVKAQMAKYTDAPTDAAGTADTE